MKWTVNDEGKIPVDEIVVDLQYAEHGVLVHEETDEGAEIDWSLRLCWRKRTKMTFQQLDKNFFCMYCIHKLVKLTFV